MSPEIEAKAFAGMRKTVNAVELKLPFPVSVNNLFINVPKRGRVRSSAYRNWALEAGVAVHVQRVPKMLGEVSVCIALCAPDKRRRDADNAAKAVLDLLATHAIIEGDDSRFVRSIQTKWVASGDPCTVTVKSIQGDLV